MRLLNPYGPKKNGADLIGAANQMKIWVRGALALSEDSVVTVSEVNCRDPSCPGVETAILVMIPGLPTRMIRIARPLAEAQFADLVAAMDVFHRQQTSGLDDAQVIGQNLPQS